MSCESHASENASKYRKIILALLQQCKDEGLTVYQSKSVLLAAVKMAESITGNRPLEL